MTQRHLSSVGADSIPHVIYGTEKEEEFSRAILDDEIEMDVKKSKEEIVRVAIRMVTEHPEIGAFVLECTNMPPYAASIQKEIGLPIFDIYTLVMLMYNAVVKRDFSGYM